MLMRFGVNTMADTQHSCYQLKRPIHLPPATGRWHQEANARCAEIELPHDV